MRDKSSENVRSYFSDLSREDVLHLAGMLNIPIEEEDLDEVRFRLSALSRELSQLDFDLLETADPMPTRTPEEAS